MHDDHFAPIRTYSSNSIPKGPSTSRSNSSSSIASSYRDELSRKSQRPSHLPSQMSPTKPTSPTEGTSTSKAAGLLTRILGVASPSKATAPAAQQVNENTSLLSGTENSTRRSPLRHLTASAIPPERPRKNNRRIATCPSPPIRPAPVAVVEVEQVDFVASGGRTASLSSVRSGSEERKVEGCFCGGLGVGMACCWRGIDLLGEAIAAVMWPRVVREAPGRKDKGKARGVDEFWGLFVD